MSTEEQNCNEIEKLNSRKIMRQKYKHKEAAHKATNRTTEHY
jgi:hypothetical protein